jgi:molecular chaperone GrpE
MDEWKKSDQGSERNAQDGTAADSPEDGPADASGADTGGASTDSAEFSTRDQWQRLVDEQREKYLRLAAEYDNFRKRAAKERQEAGWRGQGELVGGLIDALDDLTRFAHIDPDGVDARTIADGAAMVERKILKSLAGHGLEVVNPIDHPFDPALHEAVSTEPALSSEDDHLVARVYQPGYIFRGQLLRPARVVVKQWNG